MARYPDATGYLIEMRVSVREAWFSVACDMAINSTGAFSTEAVKQRLWNLFLGTELYAPAVPVALPVTTGSTLPPAHAYLEELSGFAGFRKLSPGLALHLDKQVTLVFGRNGAGKSSICQALKVLADRDAPKVPLHNAHAPTPRAVPQFSYRFTGSNTRVWGATTGYGVENQAIKYFDSTIALRHATSALDVDGTVEIVAFRLEVFDFARAIVTEFQSYMRERIASERTLFQQRIAAQKNSLANAVLMTAEPFASWSDSNFEPLAQYLATLPRYSAAHEAATVAQRARLATLTAASSEEGLNALRAQSGLLAQLEQRLTGFLTLCAPIDPQALLADIALRDQKNAALVEISRTVFPVVSEAGQQMALLEAAKDFIAFEKAGHSFFHCPLCRQALAPDAVSLFHAYQAYLTSTLKSELDALMTKIDAVVKSLKSVRAYALGDFSACQAYLPEGFIAKLHDAYAGVVNAIPAQLLNPAWSVVGSGFARRQELLGYLQFVRGYVTDVNNAINQGTANRQALTEEISQLSGVIGTASAHRAIDVARADITRLIDENRFYVSGWSRLEAYKFQPLFAAMTNKRKEAHTELVRDAFEQRLSAEYLRLAGATLSEVGVKLKTTGDGKGLAVASMAGDEPVHRVLSEGEQKVHALAVFFCEATTTPQRALILDDPVTSFDYNYVSNLCERLRDLARDQPQTQILVLTHNWDFFANLQSVFGRAQLSSRLSVQVLENCSTVDEYHEKWDELVADIDAIITLPTEPSADQKERLSGLMRRLVERLTNAYVFNEQRHQYKIKALPVSDFQQFTKLVPLTQTEANELRDLYANLSPAEHDDVRNFYTSKTRTQFVHWYTRISAIKAALIARRP